MTTYTLTVHDQAGMERSYTVNAFNSEEDQFASEFLQAARAGLLQHGYTVTLTRTTEHVEVVE